MDTLGIWLRQAREGQGSTLAEAAAGTRIRLRFLEALEAGDFAAFPGGDVQLRGFLRIYARYLGLPPDEVVARYNAEVHGVEAAQPAAPAKTRPLSPASAPTRPMTFQPPSAPVYTARPRRLSLETLMIAGVVLVALVAIVSGGAYLVSRYRGEEAAATATTAAPAEAALPSTAAQTPGTAAQTPGTAAETPAPPAATPTFPASPQGDVTLTLEATEHVWVRVTADGRTAFEGMLATEQVETWSGREVIVVETGDGAGLQVTVNGQPQGTMCGRAQVCARGWGPAGEVVVPSP
jgi:cytoskeleton protein RodZ